MQEADNKACFVSPTKWLNLVTATDNHGVAAQDFLTMSGCEQLIGEPTHQSGNRLDLVFADVTGIVFCGVSSPVGSSDHSLIKINVEMDQIVPDVSFSRKVYIRSRDIMYVFLIQVL